MSDDDAGAVLPNRGERPVFGVHSLPFKARNTAPAFVENDKPPRRPSPDYLAVRQAWREAHEPLPEENGQ